MKTDERVLVSDDKAKLLGQLMSSLAGEKARQILQDIFGSRLSYTRGEPEHTAFLEGQKSVLQFIENAVKLAQKAEEEA